MQLDSTPREILEEKAQFLGLVLFHNPLKSGTTQALDLLHHAKIRTVMITGESGTLKSGTLKSGILKSGTLKSGTLKSGTLKSGTLKSDTLKSGTLKSGTQKSETLKSVTTHG